MWRKKAADLTTGESVIFTLLIMAITGVIYGVVYAVYCIREYTAFFENVGNFFKRLFKKDLCEKEEEAE